VAQRPASARALGVHALGNPLVVQVHEFLYQVMILDHYRVTRPSGPQF
jgi:hypothetical protein